MVRRVALVLFGVCALNAPAQAQSVWIAATVQYDVQRFRELDANRVPTRLDANTAGWGAAGSVRVWKQFGVLVEWSQQRTAEDVQTLPLTINGRAVVITSTLAHSTRRVAVLGEYAHRLTPRLDLVYLAGVSWSRVGRQFTTNAPDLVLVPPSESVTSGAPETREWFDAAIASVEARVRFTERVLFVTGLRAQPMRLQLDLDGWSVRSFAGAGVMF